MSSRIANFFHFTGNTVPMTAPIASRCARVDPLSSVTTTQLVGMPGPGLWLPSPPRSPFTQTIRSDRSTPS